jgi:hypothetical protein
MPSPGMVVRDAVAVHVAVAREFADLLQLVGIEALAARSPLVG